MPSYKDLYPDKWLSPDVIRGYRPRVAIEAVNIEELYVPRINKRHKRLIVKFHGKELRLICNKTQSESLATICKTDDYTKWIGHEVVLSVGRAPSGSDTIIISPLPDKPTNAATSEGAPK